MATAKGMLGTKLESTPVSNKMNRAFRAILLPNTCAMTWEVC